MSNSKTIYDFLLSKIGNEIGVCALMGNLYVESKLDPGLLEGTKARSMNITSEEYRDRVDHGEISIDQFAHDGAGYGLAQWTYWSRKEALYKFAKQCGTSISNLEMQLEYLWKELQGYKPVITALKEASNLRVASDIVCLKYEKPKATSEKYLQNRANYGQKYLDEFGTIKMETKVKEKEGAMNSANFVDEQIMIIRNKGIPLSDQAWEFAKLMLEWAYVFGAYGDYCDPSNRRSRARSTHPTIQSKCKNFNGRDTVPAGCVGCKWFVGTAESSEAKHEGRTRFFDCRGFVYFVLHKMFGMWERCPAGATTMWKTASNWSSKGTVKEGVPKDTLVCLFVQSKDDSSKMEHIGFGYKGETIECSSGVEYHSSYNKKWTHWAVPKCIGEGITNAGSTAVDEPAGFPTLKQGSTGNDVKTMQKMLSNLGSSLTVDGIFGNGTRAALVAFQKKYGLTVDGICGPKTWAKLIEVMSVITDNNYYTVTLTHVPAKEADELISKYGGQAEAE